MPIDRFFTPLELRPHQTIPLEEKEAKHAIKVLRKKRGDVVELFNGRGYLAKGEISRIDKKGLELTPKEVSFIPPDRSPGSLIQSLIKPQKLDLVVEKGTELGIGAFHLFPADGSEKRSLSQSHIDRLHALIIAAAKQSGRLHLPTLHVHDTLKAIPLPSALFGAPSSKAPPIHSISEARSFINGPESGFSRKELDYFAERHYIGVSLSRHTLRTETAAIAAAAFLEMDLESSDPA